MPRYLGIDYLAEVSFFIRPFLLAGRLFMLSNFVCNRSETHKMLQKRYNALYFNRLCSKKETCFLRCFSQYQAI